MPYIDKIETYDKKGNLTGTTTVKFNKNGQVVSKTETDSNVNIVHTEERFYDAKGRESLDIEKDRDGNVTTRYDKKYTGNKVRTVVRNSNNTTALDNIVEITERSSDGSRSVYYKNGQTLCSEEWNGNNSVYKDANGREIGFLKFWKLKED